MKHRTNERRLSFKVNKVLHFWKSLLLLPRIKGWDNLLLQTVILNYYL